MADERDSVDRMLDVWLQHLPGVDPTVEGIVDRIGTLGKRLKNAFNETLAGFGLNHGEWSVLGYLKRGGEPFRRSPGELAKHAGLSSGAMTNRLDKLEAAGLVRRLPDPTDRRALLIELTDEGHRTWERSAAAQVAKEAAVTSALDDDEKEQLNALLRRLMLAFEREAERAELEPARPE
jgi:DNA-binding MarR family transcriptional regulator